VVSRLLGEYFRAEKKPHERDRLKHVGGLGEGQAVKVVKNGEDGTKWAWKPTTRNAHAGDVHRAIPRDHPETEAMFAPLSRNGSRFESEASEG
jgi:hypothetical protein